MCLFIDSYRRSVGYLWTAWQRRWRRHESCHRRVTAYRWTRRYIAEGLNLQQPATVISDLALYTSVLDSHTICIHPPSAWLMFVGFLSIRVYRRTPEQKLSIGNSNYHFFCGATAQLGPSPPFFRFLDNIQLLAHAHTHTHTHPVGLLWTSGQLVAVAAARTTHNKQKGPISMPTTGFEPAIPPMRPTL